MDNQKNKKNWVIVTYDGKTFYCETFDGALRMTKVIGGQVMSTQHYESQLNTEIDKVWPNVCLTLNP